MKRVLITGVYGLLGSLIYDYTSKQLGKYEVLGLDKSKRFSVRVPLELKNLVPRSHFFRVDLSNANVKKIKKVLDGVEVVIHFAADPNIDAEKESIFSNNIIATYNLFEAARLVGVKRIIFASSLTVMQGYMLDEPYKAISENRVSDVPQKFPLLTHESCPRPTSLYALGKVWGESLSRSYSENYGISCLCLRVGSVRSENVRSENNRGKQNYWSSWWCSQRDLVQLTIKCIDVDPALQFGIFYGVSNNCNRWVDIDHALKLLNYIPLD